MQESRNFWFFVSSKKVEKAKAYSKSQLPNCNLLYAKSKYRE